MTILWVDDDINKFTLRAYLDEFDDANLDVIRISDPDTFIEDFKYIEHDCLIMDIMMPSGENLTAKETKSGFETGFKLIEIYRKTHKDKRVIVFSIVTGDPVKRISQEMSIEHHSKKRVTPNELYQIVSNKNEN